jgi:prolipoprotein diacylglyceryl transferase
VSLALTTAVLASIPSPDRGVWYLGPIPIRAYALCIIAGIIVAVSWGERRFVARGGEAGTVTDVAVFAVPFGLVGGRLYHVATDWQTYFGPGADPIDALKIWQGGLGIWGAVALGAVGAWIGCRRRGVPLPFFADAVAPGIVVAQAIGRLGNWFNQELYGAPTTLPWGLEIYRRVDPATGAPDALGGVALDTTPIMVVHPTFLYELLWNLLVAALVVWADRRFRLGHGRAFALYVAGYTAGRFWIEQMRTDTATRVFGDVRINVVVSVVVFTLALLYLLLMRKPREVPAAAAADSTPAGGTAAGSTAAGRVPTESTAAESTPAGSTTAENTTAENTRAENTRAENTRAENTRAENTRAENTRAENTRAEKTSVENAPVENAPAGSTRAGSTPDGSTPPGSVACGSGPEPTDPAEPPAGGVAAGGDRDRVVAEPGERRT